MRGKCYICRRLISLTDSSRLVRHGYKRGRRVRSGVKFITSPGDSVPCGGSGGMATPILESTSRYDGNY